MKDSVTALLEGVADKWESSGLAEKTPGGIHFVEMPSTAPDELPYVVVEATDEPYFTWSDELTEITLSFYVNTKPGNDSSLLSLKRDIIEVFDFAKLTMTDWQTKSLLRLFTSSPEKFENEWAVVIEYRCTIERR